MNTAIQNHEIFPQIFPQKMSGKLTYRIRIKKEHTRVDGTNALYLYMYCNGKSKKIPLDVSVPKSFFDSKTQRIKKSYKYASDYNLLIEKILANLNRIEVNFRLNNEAITVDKVMEELKKPTIRICYNAFSEQYLENENKKQIIMKSTYRQQKSTLRKIKEYKDPLLFGDIDIDFVKEFKSHLKNNLKNKPSTIAGTMKNFKKFITAAQEKGIRTNIEANQIKVGGMKGEFTFLLPKEVVSLYKFYESPFINSTWKNILQRYLFSCFTGLRISDIEQISEDNFIEDVLVFNAKKTNKLNRIKLNKSAQSLIDLPKIFHGTYTREHINRELKAIAKACNIKKRLYFHSSRHTFATNYLISGGQVQNLQKLLGHSKIETTMVYVHTVERLKDEEIVKMDDILEL